MSDTITGSVQGFSAIVQQQAAAMQVAVATNSPGTVLDLSPGSILRTIAEAVAAVFLWLQAYALNLLKYARAATATGADLDSWMADFQFTRIQPQTATCTTVALGRYSTSAAVTYPPGGLVQTGDGTQQFIIITDTTQSAWNASAGGYVAAAGTASVLVTVQAVNSGAAGNVAAGTITSFASAVVGADFVTNTGAASGGANAETDAAFRARFWNYLEYLRRATVPAIQYAVQSIQAGVAANVIENLTPAGAIQPGYFYVIVDDGTGSPPASLLTAAGNVIEAVRGASITFGVFAPTVVTVNVSATVHPDGTLGTGALLASVQAAAQAYVNGTVLAQNLSYWKTGTAIENAVGVAELISLTLNATTADIVAASNQKIVCGTVTVAVA